MNKSIVNMTDWELHFYENEDYLSGTADYHPSLGRNVYISMTSTLETHTFEDDVYSVYRW